jgi:uncharacterized membrane protein
MSNEPMMDVTSDDKLWAALAYVFTPIVPVILMLMEDKKNRPFIRAHNAQALALGVVSVAISIFLGWTVVLLCLPFLIFVYQIYLAVQAYNGQTVEIPVITNFVKGQGWA